MREIGLLAVVVLLMAVALSPLLRADQPCTHDGGLHYFRIVAMRYALDDGLLVSRWVPDLAFGYGYPFFNYRAAVSYYLGLGLYLTGLTLPQALNTVYVLSLLGSAIGAYLLGRDLFGRRAGLVAAVAYVYAPYPFIDALVRGNMPESVALAWLPFILWAFRRLLLSGRTRYLLASTVLLALLWLSHNISSLLFTPFLVLYLLVVWLIRGRRDHLVAAGVALALGVGLTAFFWVPAVLEKDQVQLHLSRTTRNNDYHYNFITLSEVLAQPDPADPALLNPPLQLPLGLWLVVLAALGTALALWRWRGRDPQDDADDLGRRERWASVVFFALSAVAMIFMATRASLGIWENLPLIPFVQFPWRFVGRAVLPLSLLAAAFFAALPRDRQPASRLPWLAFLGSASLLVLFALPFTYPPTGYCPAEPRPDMLDLFSYERSTVLVGVDPEGSYFPVTVQARPSGSPLEAGYAAILANPDRADRAPIARFDATSLPEGAIIHQAEYTPNRARLEIETPTPVRARYLTFAFPGWRVLVDDRPVEIIPSDPEGLITFDLPAGRHVVEVAWGSTPVRAVATIVSLAALAGVAFVAYTAVRDHLVRRIRAESPPSPTAPAPTTDDPGRPFAPADSFSWAHIALLGLLALLVLAFKLAVVDRTDTLFRRPGLSAEGTLPGVDVPLDVRFDDGVRLLGYDHSTETMPTDGALHLAFYWTAYTRPSRSYKATVALVGPDGQLWSPKTAFPRRGYANPPPSPAWGDGRYAVDGLDVEPLPGTPPGPYELLLTAFDRETLAPLAVLSNDGQVIAPNLTVGQIELTRPSRSPDAADVPMQTRLGTSLGPLTLAGANLDREEAAPGDPMLVTLFW
ncbi:MAG: glycosyltransferase family 39 protein, partial [Anaerolineae bacterium]